MLEGVARLRRALGIDIQQLRGYVAHFFRRFLPRPRPGIAAELVQRGIFFRTARIATDQMQGRHRHIEFGVVGVQQHQVFTLDAARFQGSHPRITAYAMLQMDNRLAGMQLRQVADQRVRVDGATVVLTTARHALTQQIAFADQRQIIERINKPMFGGADHQIASVAAGVVQAQDPLRRDLNAAKQLAQRLTAPFAFHREDHRAGKGFEELTQVIQRRFVLCLHREVRQRLIGQVGIGSFLRQAVGFELHARPAFQLAEQLIGAQPQQLGLQQRAHRINPPVFKAGAGFTLETAGAGLQIAGVEHQRVGREIAEQGRQRLAEEQRLPVFDP